MDFIFWVSALGIGGAEKKDVNFHFFLFSDGVASCESGRRLLLEVSHWDPHPDAGRLPRALLQEGRGAQLVLPQRLHLPGQVMREKGSKPNNSKNKEE